MFDPHTLLCLLCPGWSMAQCSWATARVGRGDEGLTRVERVGVGGAGARNQKAAALHPEYFRSRQARGRSVAGALAQAAESATASGEGEGVGGSSHPRSSDTSIARYSNRLDPSKRTCRTRSTGRPLARAGGPAALRREWSSAPVWSGLSTSWRSDLRWWK